MNILNKFLIFLFAGICATAPFTACSSKGGGSAPPAQTTNGITRRSILSDQQIVSNTPPISSATATATVTLNPATGSLSGTVTLSNFTAGATAVTINEGDIGANGSPVVFLTETPAGSGIWTIPQTTTALTATQMDSFKAAGYHIIVETSANPNGEIRGQLISYADNIQPIFDQNCVSCHSAGGAASATGLFLDQANSYSRLVNQAATQSPGTRVVPFDTSNSVLIKRLQGTLPGLTRMPPAGPLAPPDANLIRVWVMMGAINDGDVFPVPPPPRTLFTRRALLDPNQVVAASPPLSSLSGTAAATLNTATNSLTITVTLNDPAHTATAVHINDGDVGSTGTPVVSLSETPAGSGSWTATVTTLSAAQVDRFKNAGFSANVDTAANPNGEIRGQLLSYADNIQAVFDNNCTICHFGSGPASFTGLLLLPASSYTNLVNQVAVRSTGVRVVPSDANNSVLFQRITATGPASVVGSQMPPPESHLPALAQRDQDLIKTWINMKAIDDNGVVKSPSTPQARQFIRNSFLNPAQIVSTVSISSTATATATFSLNEATSRLTGTVVISNVPAGRLVVSVHINNGYADSAGPALPIGLLETPIGSGVYTIPAAATLLTATQMNTFMAGGLYVAVDTQLLGITREEVRGQIQTFKDDVQPLFNGRCVKCHNPGAGNLVQGQSYAALVNVPATQSAGTLVIPGDAAGSVLYNRLTGNLFPPPAQMPKDGPPYLTTRETSIIKAWIVMGAPND